MTHALILGIHGSMIATLTVQLKEASVKLKVVVVQPKGAVVKLKEAAAVLQTQLEKFGMSACANGSLKSGILKLADGRTRVILAGQE